MVNVILFCGLEIFGEKKSIGKIKLVLKKVKKQTWYLLQN